MQKARPAQGRRILRCVPSLKVRGLLLYADGCGALPSCLLDMSQPGFEGVILPLHYSEERLLQFMRDGTGTSTPNRAIVHFTNRGNLLSCSRKEDLVSDIEFITRKDHFMHCQSEMTGQIHNGIPRNTFKYRGERRGLEFTTPDNEDVFARAFRDVTLDIQHDRFI